MPRTKKHPEERRSEIIAAARHLFLTKGIENTSISDIVKAAGIAQGTFYLYFDSKEAIIEAVIEEMADEISHDIPAIPRNRELSAPQKIIHVVDELYAAVRRSQAVEYFQHGGNRQIRSGIIEAITKRLLPPAGQIIAEGMRERAFNLSYPDETATVVAVAIQAIYSMDMHQDDVSAQRWKEALTDFILKGLGFYAPLSYRHK